MSGFARHSRDLRGAGRHISQAGVAAGTGEYAAAAGTGPFNDKNVTVVESWFYTAAETTDYGSVSTDRDSARVAIDAAQESPWGTI